MDPIFFAPSARTMYFLTAHLVVKLKSSSNSLRYLCFFSIETIRHGLNRKLYRRTLHQNLIGGCCWGTGSQFIILSFSKPSKEQRLSRRRAPPRRGELGTDFDTRRFPLCRTLPCWERKHRWFYHWFVSAITLSVKSSTPTVSLSSPFIRTVRVVVSFWRCAWSDRRI